MWHLAPIQPSTYKFFLLKDLLHFWRKSFNMFYDVPCGHGWQFLAPRSHQHYKYVKNGWSESNLQHCHSLDQDTARLNSVNLIRVRSFWFLWTAVKWNILPELQHNWCTLWNCLFNKVIFTWRAFTRNSPAQGRFMLFDPVPDSERRMKNSLPVLSLHTP